MTRLKMRRRFFGSVMPVFLGGLKAEGK